MLTNSRHTTGIRHAPRQWYFIHPVIIVGTVFAPITTTSDAGLLNSAFHRAAEGRKAVELQLMRTDPTGLAAGWLGHG